VPNTLLSQPLRHIRLAAAVLGVLLILVPVTAARAESADEQRVVVTFAPRTDHVERAEALENADVEPIDPPQVDSPLVVATATDAERAALQDDPAVAVVEADVPVRADLTAIDPAYPLQHGVREIRANLAWDNTTGTKSVIIAIVDTGVDAANPDLAGKLVPGHDFVQGDADPADDHGHGTAVAGVAAASSNAYAIAGVCWQCRIMPIKALDHTGVGYLSDAARGIAWAVDHGADVINLSLSGTQQLSAMSTALQAAERAGVLVVASAGNASTTTKHWPAADPLALAVAATDGGSRATYSNYGEWVDVAAPGCNPANKLGGNILNFCGTSSSAPLVAGAAALARSVAPDISGSVLRQAFKTTASPLGGGLGAGIINANAVVGVARSYAPAAPPTPTPPTPTPTPTQEPPAPAPTPSPAQPRPVFRDIGGSVHRGSILKVADAGITSGCAADAYCPGGTVTRGQIATFLTRALDLPAGTASFRDVPANHPHAAGIAAVASAGITKGCARASFCPGAGLTRGQMAALLHRALDLPAGTASFRDVPANHPHAAGIAAVAAASITSGCGSGRFCPDATVTRGQMASFLARALDL
jgi:subtilisin family serine protease